MIIICIDIQAMYYGAIFLQLALIILKIINDVFEENIFLHNWKSLENNILEKNILFCICILIVFKANNFFFLIRVDILNFLCKAKYYSKNIDV